jgi:hypothetical protein
MKKGKEGDTLYLYFPFFNIKGRRVEMRIGNFCDDLTKLHVKTEEKVLRYPII